MKKQKNHSSRRNFLKNGIMGIAGAAFLPRFTNKNLNFGNNLKKNKIIYRKLGATGLELSIVGLGGPEHPALITNAFEKGINHINTSPEYGRGNQETMIGKTLLGIPRDSYIIGTGFSMWRKPQNQIKHYTKEMIINSFEASLKRLNLDYVDIYYLMGVSEQEAVLHAPFLEAMESLKKSGKARFIGLTVHQNEVEVLNASVQSKFYDVVLTSYNFRKIYRDEIKKEISAAAKAGIGIIAMKTQAGVYWDQKTKDMINMKAALKWVLQNENVHAAVPEFGSLDEMKEGLSVMEDLTLTPKEKQDLRLDKSTSPDGLFCQHCGKCLPQCKGDFDIPTMMRSYMYAYGYNKPAKAKEALEHLDISQILCSDCSQCPVQCTMGFDIREKVLDIIRIKSVPYEFLI
jgi:predicted aldo/keto reductase-like oxidoreductase